MSTFEHRIQGIPCTIEVTRLLRVKGSHRHDEVSDLDYYGYSEIEFNVLDRKGYAAAWLERKLNDRDIEEIEGRILELFDDV